MSMAQMAEIMADVNAKRDYVRARLAAESPFPIGAEATAAVHREIETLGLTRNTVELETQGYTVLTPEQVDSRELVPRLNEAIGRVVANPARFGSLVGLTEHIPWIYGPWGEPSPVGVHYPVTGIYQHE